jgi:hypothetical protein
MSPTIHERQHAPPVAKEILNYFMRNPRAADNLEGIARWRLLDEVIRLRVEETRRALAWLVEQGFLIETVSRSSDPIFALNRSMIGEARGFLDSEDATANAGSKS